MRSHVLFGLSIVPMMLACSAAPTGTASSSSARAPVRTVVERRGKSLSIDAVTTRFARKVGHSSLAASLRAPWAGALPSGAPEGARIPELGAIKPPVSHLYPAFQPDAPQVVDSGAPTLSAMKIVTLTWDGDPFADALEAFGDDLGSSPYWQSISEYGVGPASSGYARHFRGAGFPATITDVQLDAMVQASVANAASGWPANAPQQIYAVYLPPSTTFLVDNGDGTTTPACQLFGAYHTATQPAGPDGGASAPSIIYSVMPRCPGFGIDTITLASAHEFGEAATDSYATGQPAYVGFDEDHLAYDIYQAFQDEIGDACEFFEASGFEAPPPFTFNVQRLWSNRSAMTGHNPCLPRIAGEAYYNTTPIAQLDDIQVDFTNISAPGTCTPATCTVQTKGIKVPLGQSRSFDIGFYSDAPTGDWTVHAFALPHMPIPDASGNPVLNGAVNVTIQGATGHNGHVAHVTVTPLTAGAIGAQYIELQSGYGQYDEAHTLPILVSQN